MSILGIGLRKEANSTGDEISEAVIKGQIDQIEDLVKGRLDNGTAPGDILKSMLDGMAVVSEKFETKEYYVPETLLSAHAMQRGLDLLKPHLEIEKAETKGRVLIGTVEGDIHDIGKNLVAMFLEGAGFHVLNLGRDVPTEEFIEKAREFKPHIIGLSAMMSTTMETMGKVIERFKEEGLADHIFIIGGAATTDDFRQEIGAHGHAPDAAKAVKLCERLMRER